MRDGEGLTGAIAGSAPRDFTEAGIGAGSFANARDAGEAADSGGGALDARGNGAAIVLEGSGTGGGAA